MSTRSGFSVNSCSNSAASDSWSSEKEDKSMKRKGLFSEGGKITDLDVEEPLPRRLKSMDPDLVVVVGGVEFSHYKSILCAASPFFDAALAAGMKESEQNRIELPDKDPSEWPVVYNFLDPLHYKGSSVESLIRRENAISLATWFDFLCVKKYNAKCDNVLLLAEDPSCSGKLFQNGNTFQLWQERWGECRNLQCLPRYKTRMLDHIKKSLELTCRDKMTDGVIDRIKVTLMDEDIGNEMWTEFLIHVPFPERMLKDLDKETIMKSPLFGYFVESLLSQKARVPRPYYERILAPKPRTRTRWLTDDSA